MLWACTRGNSPIPRLPYYLVWEPGNEAHYICVSLFYSFLSHLNSWALCQSDGSRVVPCPQEMVHQHPVYPCLLPRILHPLRLFTCTRVCNNITDCNTQAVSREEEKLLDTWPLPSEHGTMTQQYPLWLISVHAIYWPGTEVKLNPFDHISCSD